VLLDLETRDIFVSRNVVFKENCFSFISEQTRSVVPDSDGSLNSPNYMFYDPLPLEQNVLISNPVQVTAPSTSLNSEQIQFSDTDNTNSISNSDSQENQQPWRSSRVKFLPSHLADYHLYLF
jgi:hypothetical protein